MLFVNLLHSNFNFMCFMDALIDMTAEAFCQNLIVWLILDFIKVIKLVVSTSFKKRLLPFICLTLTLKEHAEY